MGLSTTSTPVSVTVSNNTPPTVSITVPANNATFAVGVPINITATASDAAPGTVASVVFFDGATQIGVPDTVAPYNATLTNATAGTHTFDGQSDRQLGVVHHLRCCDHNGWGQHTANSHITVPENGATFAPGVP